MSSVGSKPAVERAPITPDASVPSRGGFLPALTGLRFFAALHVIGHHLRSSRLVELSAWPEVDRFFQRAGATVGLFFILSGFILTYGHLQRLGRRSDSTGSSSPTAFSAASFYRERLARLYPVYLLGLLLSLPLFLIERSYLGGGIGSAETLVFYGLVLTLTQAWLPQAALAWNVPGWSLSVEFFFYLLFPAAFAALRHRSRGAILLGIVACGVIASGLAFYVAFSGNAVRAATGLTADQLTAVMKYDPLVRLPEFLFGMLLGRLFFLREAERSQRTAGRRATALALLFIAILSGCPSGVLDLPIHNGLLAPLIGLLLWNLALGGSGRLVRLLSHPTTVALGQASFSLYILHTPIIQFARIIGGGRGATTLTSPAIALGAVATSITVALLVRTYFEEPMRKRWTGRRVSLKSVEVRPLATQPVDDAAAEVALAGMR